MEKTASVIQTKRLILRPFADRDREAILRIFFCEEVKKTYMIPDFTSEAQAEKLFLRMKELSREDGHFVAAITLGGKMIGFLNDCGADENGTIEIGYVIHPDYQGNGYMTEALGAVIPELFRIGYRRVIAGFFEENTASRRVMEKCGMRRLPEEEDISYRGKIHHCIYYGADAPEKN